MSGTDLFAQQEANRRRSRWLVVGFIAFFAWVGFGGDLAFGLLTTDAPPESYHHTIPFTGIAAILTAATITWSAWRNGDQRILRATRAWEIVEPATPEQQQLVNVVEEMAIAAGLPRPRIWIVPEDDPNAFATGRDPETASIAVTSGLLDRLNRDELQGVVAHEMAHIQNYDTRLMTLLAAMVGAIALMSDRMGRFLRHGRRHGRGSRSGGKGGGGSLGMVILALWLITLVVAPLVSRILAMSVSRKREYLADATAAQFTRNPIALASALEKLDGVATATRSISRGAAHLCIIDPGERKLAQHEGFLGNLFASHPPIRMRIAQLKAMGYRQMKEEGVFPSGPTLEQGTVG